MDVEKLHNEVLRAFNDSCVIATRQQYRGRGFRPAADAFFEEDTREIVVRFELAGMAMDDIELLVDRRELVVRGERAFPTRRGPRLPAGGDGLRPLRAPRAPHGRRRPRGHHGDLRGRRPRGAAHARPTREQGARKIDIQTGGGDE